MLQAYSSQNVSGSNIGKAPPSLRDHVLEQLLHSIHTSNSQIFKVGALNPESYPGSRSPKIWFSHALMHSDWTSEG